MTYLYLGDNLSQYKEMICDPVLNGNGKCIRGRNSNMVVRFDNGDVVNILARRLRKLVSLPETMKCIMLKDYGPGEMYASMVYQGKKPIESRTWRTSYRGDILIGCSKASKSEFAGMAICVVELYHIEEMRKEHEKYVGCELYDRANAWYLKNLRRILNPFPIKGKLSIFNVDVPEDSVMYSSGLYHGRLKKYESQLSLFN